MVNFCLPIYKEKIAFSQFQKPTTFFPISIREKKEKTKKLFQKPTTFFPISIREKKEKIKKAFQKPTIFFPIYERGIMETKKETINIGGRVLLVEPKTALEIRQKIVARLKRDARITEELRREKLLPSGFYNQTARWTKPERSVRDTIDGRSLQSKQCTIIETRFPDSLRREWTVV